MRKKWFMIGGLTVMITCLFTGCKSEEKSNANKETIKQESGMNDETKVAKSGKEYSGTGYKLNLGEEWIQQEMPGTELYFEYGKRTSDEDWLCGIYSQFYYLDNYGGNAGTVYNQEMQNWKAGGFEILSSERKQEGAITYYRTELGMSEGSMIQYFVIQHNTQYNFVLLPNDHKDKYDTVVQEFDAMMEAIEWEDIVREEVDIEKITPKEVTEADVEAWNPVSGTGYTMKCSEFWYPYDIGIDLYLAQEDVIDGYKELFICSVMETAMSTDEGFANFEKLMSGDNHYEVVESGQEIQIGDQKGYSLVTKQELKYTDIYRQTYYTIVNGKEYAFTFQADAHDYAYLKLEKEAMFHSIVFE